MFSRSRGGRDGTGHPAEGLRDKSENGAFPPKEKGRPRPHATLLRLGFHPSATETCGQVPGAGEQLTGFLNLSAVSRSARQPRLAQEASASGRQEAAKGSPGEGGPSLGGGAPRGQARQQPAPSQGRTWGRAQVGGACPALPPA